MLEMFTSMEAEQASLPTTGKAAKAPDGKKRREAKKGGKVATSDNIMGFFKKNSIG